VIACKWKDGKQDCYEENGFRVQPEVNYEVRVQLTNITAGTRFRCNTLPSDYNVQVQECQTSEGIAT
jgi:hypothetical protein